MISTDVDVKDFPSYTYICIIIMFILMALTLISKLDLFVKISTYSVVFVFMTLIFLVAIGIYSLGNTNFVFSDTLPQTVGTQQIKLFNHNIGPLLGILCGAFYLHNITLPIVRNAKEPNKIPRDLFLGYFLVMLSYIACGVMGYIGFTGTAFTSDPNFNGILSNCLLMFKPGNIIATIIRACLVFKLFSVMCLMFACQRAQLYLLIAGDSELAEK